MVRPDIKCGIECGVGAVMLALVQRPVLGCLWMDRKGAALFAEGLDGKGPYDQENGSVS